MSLPAEYGRPLAGLCAATLRALLGFDAAARRLHPPALPGLREELRPHEEALAASLAELDAAPVPPGLDAFHGELTSGADHARQALAAFLEPAPAELAAARILEAMRGHCRAQEALYPLRAALPPLGRYFAEPGLHERLGELDPDPPEGVSVGLHRTGDAGDPDARGGFSLYVPERYDGSEPLPLVVALHGGFGHGRDFLFTWLREARSRRFLLLAPTSRRSTWSLDAPDLDRIALHSMVAYVAERWQIDADRVLLTGLSDGATFALLAGLGEDTPFTALAPVSGVLHPANFALGNVERAKGRRIRLVHGALDWLFPVTLARQARDTLLEAGAELSYREIADLSHAYPREENDAILRWFDPALG